MGNGDNRAMAVIDDRSALHVRSLRVSSSVTLEPYEQEVIVDIPAGAVTITLPNCAASFGRMYSFYAMTDAGGSVNIVGGGDEETAFAITATMIDTGDRVVVKNIAGVGWALCAEV